MKTHPLNTLPYLLARTRTALFGTALLVIASTAQANLISNSSFEDTTGYNGGIPSTVPSWATLGGTFGDVINATGVFTSGLTGTNAIYILGNIYQTVTPTFVAGQTYTLSFDVGRPLGAAANSNGIQFGFRNSANTEFLTGADPFVDATMINAIPTGTFQTYSLNYVAKVADAGNPVTVWLTDFFEGSANVRFDNVVTTAVPEPGFTASAIGAVLLGLVALRSRHRSKQEANPLS